MNRAEAAELLALAATFDNRHPNMDAVTSWSEALSDVRADDARRAVVEHYRTDRRWIMPSDVMDGVRKIVKERTNQMMNTELPAELEEMEDGPEFTAAYLEWLRSGQVPQTALSA